MTSEDLDSKAYSELYKWKTTVDDEAFKILQAVDVFPSQNERIEILMKRVFDGKNNVSGDVPNNMMYLFSKNPTKSESFRKSGNKCALSGFQIVALSHYTKALVYSIPNTEMSSILYNSRSAVLYDYGMFESCLDDMGRVSLLDLPQKYKASYFLRKAICHRSMARSMLQQLVDETDHFGELGPERLEQMTEALLKYTDIPRDRGNEVCYTPIIPIIKNKNALIPGLSDAVKLSFTEDLGRHIIATRDIQPGELIGVSQPYASAVSFEQKVSFCWHCTKQISSGVPCERCINALYCSDYCREKSFEAYHDIECTVTASLGTTFADDVALMTLRLVIKAYKESGSQIDKLLLTYNINATPPTTKDEVYKSNYDITKFSSVWNLSKEYSPLLNIMNSEQFADSVIIAYYLGISIGLVKDNQSLIELKECDKFVKFLGFIEKTMRIVYTNIITYEPICADLPEALPIYKLTINPSTAFFKNRCFSDIARINLDEYEAIYTISPIQKGQLIFDNYGYNFFDVNREQRRIKVAARFGNVCHCIACVNDWSVENSILRSVDVDSLDLKKTQKSIQILKKKVDISRNMSADYLRKNKKLNDVSNIVDELIQLVTTCHKYLQPNSADLVKAKSTLLEALRLSQVPLTTPE